MFQGVLRMLFSAALAAAMPAASWAADYPDRPIRWLVPFSAGGGSDLATRIVARHVGQTLGQPVVVENRPGAATIVAAQEAARAQPDGYTVLTAGMSTLALNPWLYDDLPYDPQQQLTPVSTLVALPIVLVAAPDSGLHTLDDVKTYLKREPPGSYASLGVGSPHHLAMELFMETVGGRATAVPYKGSPPALQDVAAGVVPLMMADLAAARPLIQAGRLRAIAVPSAKRSAQLPGVPTFAEAGGPIFEAAAWQGVVAPAGTPAPIVAKINRDLQTVLQAPDVRAQLEHMGFKVAGGSPADLGQSLQSERPRYARAIQSAGLSLR